MKKLLTVLSAIIAISAQAKDQNLPDPAKMRANVLYLLTENRAKALNIDLSQIKRQLSVKESERVAIYFNEKSELNLSIFDEETFNQLSMDIIK